MLAPANLPEVMSDANSISKGEQWPRKLLSCPLNLRLTSESKKHAMFLQHYTDMFNHQYFKILFQNFVVDKGNVLHNHHT